MRKSGIARFFSPQLATRIETVEEKVTSQALAALPKV